MGDIQRLLVMRHGERLDSLDRQWKKRAPRPYDTPLTKPGEKEVFRVAQSFAGKEIAMVISSPFLRCLQTAQQACNALELPGVHTFNGLCEIVAPECNMRGAPEVPAMADVEACGITLINVDSSPFAGYPEKVTDAIARYQLVLNSLADQHWPHNLLLVTHEYAVKQAMVIGGCTDEVEATYCGHVELSRTDRSVHAWNIERYSGVYKYDN